MIAHVFEGFMVAVAGENLKAFAQVRLPSGRIKLAEIHWYEAHGIGRREFKLKLPFLQTP